MPTQNVENKNRLRIILTSDLNSSNRTVGPSLIKVNSNFPEAFDNL